MSTNQGVYLGKLLYMIVLIALHSFSLLFLCPTSSILLFSFPFPSETHVTHAQTHKQFLLQSLISGIHRNHGYMFSETVEMCGDDRYGISEIEEFPICQLDANQMQTITESTLTKNAATRFFLATSFPP